MMWYESAGRDNDVAVSSRVRLARNLTDYPFGSLLNDASAKEIIERVKNVFEGVGDYTFTDYSDLEEIERKAAVEKHKVSAEFASSKKPRALIESERKQVYIMTPEEDHIRIQSILAGFSLEEALSRAREADETIDGALNVAYNDKLGYLTHCPTNLGTGMRASVMLFLPALTISGGIRALSAQLGKIGLTIRGMSGEGSSADGCLYQVSNQITLGISEEEIVSKLSKITESIIEKERNLRQKIKSADNGRFEDRVMRSYGVMMYATMIDTNEMMRLYADVRLGAALGIIDGASLSELDKMMVRGMAANLTCENKEIKTPEERDRARAELIRRILSGAE